MCHRDSVYHFRVQKRQACRGGLAVKNRFTFSVDNGPRFPDVVKLIEYYTKTQGTLPTLLSQPVLR